MTSNGATPLRAAARNNAAWCAAVCRSHGIPSTFGKAAWTSPRRTPTYYPDAVTLRPDTVPADVLSGVDTMSPGCSVKDSFAALDLAAHGFAELFTAQWVHRRPGPAKEAAALRAEPVSTAAGLRDWQAAWQGGAGAPDVFRPALLDDPSVRVLALRKGADLCGGAVLNRAAGLVGVSNVFTVDGGDAADAWSSVTNAAGESFPGLPLTGYEHGDGLAQALAAGFAVLGPLRIWAHGA